VTAKRNRAMRTMATTKASETEFIRQLLTLLATSEPLQQLSRLN
jgi:hypothetical protein